MAQSSTRKKRIIIFGFVLIYSILFYKIGYDIYLIESDDISGQEMIKQIDMIVSMKMTLTKSKLGSSETDVAKPKFQQQRMSDALDLQAKLKCSCNNKSFHGNITRLPEKYLIRENGHICMQKKFPNAILVGMTKAGTSALMRFLEDHPMIAPRTSGPKDTRYFNHYYKTRSHAWYRNIMPCSSSYQVTVSKSTEYFFTPGVAERIREFDPSMKIIIILREPIARALSHYVMWTNQGKLKGLNISFEEAITKGPKRKIDTNSRLIVVSNYQRHAKAWLDNFNTQQILILNGDNFVNNPANELNKLEEFLEVDQYFTQEKFVFDKNIGHFCLSSRYNKTECVEKNSDMHHPIIEDRMRIKLERFFRPRNKKFFQMIGRHNLGFEY